MKSSTAEPRFPPADAARTTAELTEDLFALARLQWELLQADLAEAIRRLIIPMALVVVAFAVGLAAAPMALLTVAAALYAWTSLSLFGSLAVTVTGALAMAAIGVWYAARRWRDARKVFARSRDELQRNVLWIRELSRHDWRATSGAGSHPHHAGRD